IAAVLSHLDQVIWPCTIDVSHEFFSVRVRGPSRMTRHHIHSVFDGLFPDNKASIFRMAFLDLRAAVAWVESFPPVVAVERWPWRLFTPEPPYGVWREDLLPEALKRFLRQARVFLRHQRLVAVHLRVERVAVPSKFCGRDLVLVSSLDFTNPKRLIAGRCRHS